MAFVRPEVNPKFAVFEKSAVDPTTRKPVSRPWERAVPLAIAGIPSDGALTFAYEYTFGSLPPRKDQVVFLSAAVTGLSSATRLIAESEESLTEFVRRKVGLPRGKARITARDLVILQFLAAARPIFPGEPSFTDELADHHLMLAPAP
jgi:hypothetical protein